MNKKKKTKKNSVKTKVVNFLIQVIVFIGLGAIAYPTLSNWWNERHATAAIATYVESVHTLKEEQVDDMLLEAYTYNEKIGTDVDFVLTEEEYAAYESILDITGTGIMGYLEIPSIAVNLPIYHGTDEGILQIAAGHIAGSSFPVGGKGTHAIISGHRGLPSAKLFTDLDRLAEGDVFTITVLNQLLTYQVDQIRIVLPEDTSGLAVQSGEDYVTLVTCTPYGVNSHRMLVRGKRIDNLEGEKAVIVVSEATRISPTYVFCGICIPLIMLAMLISFIFSAVKGITKPKHIILEEMENSSVDSGGVKHEKEHHEGE